MDVILASASPRRKELLSQIVLDFRCIPADIDESQFDGEVPEVMAEKLALAKAEIVAFKYPDSLVIGADTIVVLDGRVLGKPVDKENAREMLGFLSGRRHKVISAFSVICQQENISVVKSFITEIEFFTLSKQDIENYLETEEPYDKAGAYAFQGEACRFIKDMSGSPSNVIGLNVGELKSCLDEFVCR